MNENISVTNNEPENENDIKAMLHLLLSLLTSPKLPVDVTDEGEIPDAERFSKYEGFTNLVKTIVDIRALSESLNKGELNKFVYSKGYILSNLKALQSNLRHLTWQTKKIAQGDFTQKVDFLGEFSNSFNEMATKLKQSSEKLIQLANIDPLTNIPNRLFLDKFLLQTFENFQLSGELFSVMMMDIDFFKKVNDTYGHEIGDKVLMKMTERLKVQFRSTDIFARYGGEEFMAVLPNMKLDIATKTANRVLSAVNQTPLLVNDELSLNITISIGVSQAIPEDDEYSKTIKRSDQALYMAKENGRNQVVCL